MRLNSFSFRLSLLFSIVLSVAIILTGITISLVFYLRIEQDTHLTLKNRANSIVSDYITYDGSELIYRNGPEGESISSRLRDFDVSAIVFDSKLSKIGVYGYYKNLSDKGKVSEAADDALLKKILENKKTVYRDYWSSNILYDTFTIPLIFENKSVGVLQVLRQNSFITNLFEIGVSVLILVLPLFIFISVILVFILTKFSFIALNDLIHYMDTVNTVHLPPELNPKGAKTEELITLTRAFNSMIERLRIAVEKQKNYAAHLSHEIKTPITRMVSSLEVVLYNLGKVPDNDNIQITRSVRDELLSLGKLTDSILAATGNTLSVHSEEKNILSLSKELNSSLSDYEADIKRRKIKTVINCDKSIRIKISKEHMTIILSNLLSNAVKYSKQGGVISMGCINDNGIVSLSVYNMGPKIKDAEKTLIFKRFFRGSFHRNVAEGTGLGLALVQEICALDNLQISLNSSEYGTIFTVSGFQILS